VTKSERVCSQHFSTTDIIYSDKNVSLTVTAVPINPNKSGMYNFLIDTL
jgi:hypothetical protein